MRPRLTPNVGGAVTAVATVARNRRNFRMNIAPFMSDTGLAAEMAEMAARVNWIRGRNGSTASEREMLARLRACRHEAVISRGWDAHDDNRVKWEHAR